MTEQNTKELEALESIQDLIGGMEESRRHQILVFVEDFRDILNEGQGDAFLALTLVACEFAATNAELEKQEAADAEIVAG